MNRVYILGRLGGAPELHEAKSGEPYCRLRIATNRGKDQADWHSVFVFGKLAETCAKHLGKGATVLIEGRLSYWQSQDSETKVYSQSIKADEVQFITLAARADHLDNPGAPRNHDAVAHPA